MKSKKQQAVELADYIHEQALAEDKIFKYNAIRANKAMASEGESGMVFHTRTLLNLIKELKSHDC